MSDDEEAVPSMSAAVGNEAILAAVATDAAEIVAKRAREDPERFRPAVLKRLKRAKTGLDEAIACFECPISHAGPMVEPVQAADGNSYEKAAYMRWLAKCKEEGKGVRSPLTNESIRPWFSDNLALRKTITSMVESGLIPESELAGYRERAAQAAGLKQLKETLFDSARIDEHAAACRSLMHLYGNGNLVVLPDARAAMFWAEEGARRGDPVCRERYAGALLSGTLAGGPDVVQGIQQLTRAAAEGVDAAMIALACLLDDGEDDDGICLDSFGGADTRKVVGKDYFQAHELLVLADRRRTDGTTAHKALAFDGPEEEMEFWRGVKVKITRLKKKIAAVPAPASGSG
jgi:hypothetical protein